MLAQPKLLSWSSAKARILNQLYSTSTKHEESPYLSRRTSSVSSRIVPFPLFSSRSLTKFRFYTHLQTFVYYQSINEDSNNVEDIIIASLFYDDPKDPRSAIFVYFTSLNTGIIRRCLKYDFQFPSFQLLKYVSKLKLIIGYSNNRLYLLSNKNGDLKYLTSISCPGTARRIIYDKTSRDIIYVGGDKGLFVRWYLVRETNGYDLRLGDRLKSGLINGRHNIIDMKLDPITHKLFIIGHKGCLIFDTLLNRESASVLSAHGAPVTCANIYGFSIIMGFSDGAMKIFEISSESIPLRYQFQAHRAPMINLLITTDGIIITGAEDGTICFYSLESLIKLGEHRFTESIERMMFIHGEDLLIKFKNDLQLLTYTLPIRSFSGAIQSIEQLRVTFPVGSIPSRVVLRSPQNLFTIYNSRSAQIINTIRLSPDRIIVNDFIYDTAGEILYILTSKTVCSYHCGTQPSYLINIFEVNDECLFTKLCCMMWFSLLPEHTKKRRAFGIVFVGTTNGKLYLIPSDHGLKYALSSDTPAALYSYFQILNNTTTVGCLEIFQAYETYTTRRGARYLLAIGNDFIAKFYRLSINGHEIFLRELGLAIHLDAPCIGAAMAEQRIAIACALRGYIQMYAITIYGLDEISPKDILHEYSPIKSLTGCDTLGLFITLNNINEIMLWAKTNEVIRKLQCDIPLISIANLTDRGDILLVSNRRLHFLMISDYAPEQVLFDLTKKTIKDNPIELPVQFNKNFDTNLVESAQTVRIDERATTKVSEDFEETDTLGFFEAIEHEKAKAEMAKMLKKKKKFPIAPDAFIPNSALRSTFKIKQIEPIQMKMFQLRLILPPISNTNQTDFDERLKRYSVLTNFDGIHSTIFQLLNKIDILDNLQSQSNKNLNWQNDDDEWVELGDPEASFADTTSKPTSAKKSKSTGASRQKDTIPELFQKMRNENWWKQSDDDSNNNLRSMLLYLIDVLRDKEIDSYESACNYIVEVFRTYGIEPTLVDQIFGVLLDHLALSENNPLDIHTVRTIAQFMTERKNIIIQLLNFALKQQSNDILRQETINSIKFITDVNSSDDIDLVFNNMSIVQHADPDTFSLKTIIEIIKTKLNKDPSNLTNESEEKKDILHPLLKKISEERWYPRDNNPITFDLVLNNILNKLPNASKTMLKTLTTNIVQLQRVIGYSDEQYNQVSNGLLSLLSHIDADYRLIAATVLADLGKETKSVDIALLNSFLNDPRILVRTECCDTLKKLSGIMSDTVLKDCADDIPYLKTLSEENFTLQNYLNEKNRVPTPLLPTETIDEQSSLLIEDESKVLDEQELPINENKQEESDINYLPINDIPSFVRSRSVSPHNELEQSNQINNNSYEPIASQFSITTNSSTANVTPTEPRIRVEISEKSKTFIPLIQTRQEPTRASPPPPPPPSSQQHRFRKQPTELNNQTSIKITVSDQTTGRRHLLLPNNSNMWDSYAKQNEFNEENNSQLLSSTEFPQEQISDPVQTIINDHKINIGYYRMRPNRPVLVPHKISFDDIFADQSHMTVDAKVPLRVASYTANTMQLSDLNRNKRHLQEVEFVQLLSSLVIRSIQIHKKHERLIPGPYSLLSDSSVTFTDALSISQMQIHSPTNLDQMSLYVPNKLPSIVKEASTSTQLSRMKTDVQTRAKRTGVNLRKAKDMEDALSNLLKTDRERSRSTFVPANTPHPTTIVSTTDHSEITHAWLLEQLLKSQGATDPHSYIHQICRAYPKFTPLLHSRVPQGLIPIIWNDSVMKRLAAIVGNKQDDSSSVEEYSMKRAFTKSSVPTYDDDHSSNFFDYSALSHLSTMQQQQRDEHKKKSLPPIHGVKMRLPRHVLKFGFREIEDEPPEASLDSLRDENISKSRRRKIYMHLMMSVNENALVRHELVKSQLRHMLKTDSRSSSFLPIIAKPPTCN